MNTIIILFNIYRYIDSLYLITLDDPNFIDCFQTLDFIRRNIHLNLYNEEHVKFYFYACNLDDMEVEF